MKPYAEQTAQERLVSLDRVLNVLIHPDWSEMYAMLSDDSVSARRQMEEAANWDTFVAARAVYLYVTERLMKLREHVSAEKADLEADKAVPETLPPTDYELE